MEDWKKKVSREDIDAYKQIDVAINEALSDLTSYGEEELRTLANIISKLKAEQKKIMYKYDFARFVDDMFSGDGDISSEEPRRTPYLNFLYNN